MTANPLTETVSRLIDAGCHYRLEALAELYTPDLSTIIVQEDGSVASFDYAQNMAFFRQLREQNAPPLNTAVHFNHAAEHGGIGYVVATRQMNLGAGEKKIVFTLMLRQTDGGPWQIFREHAVVVGDAPSA
ncbi:nuclear transport factor 2 family protein [Cardiobacterium hominis]